MSTRSFVTQSPEFPLSASKEMLENIEYLKKTKSPKLQQHLKMMKTLNSFDPTKIDLSLPSSLLPKTFEFKFDQIDIEDLVGGELRESSKWQSLEKSQLKEMWFRGAFTSQGMSRSRRYKCNSLLIPGLKALNRSFLRDISHAYDLVILVRDLFYNDSGRVSITNGFVQFVSLYKSLIHIFVGYPLKEINRNSFEIKQILQKERMKRLLENPIIDKELLEQGNLGKTQIFFELQKTFEREWHFAEAREIESSRKSQAEMTAIEMKIDLIKRRQEKFLDYLEKNYLENCEQSQKKLAHSFLNYYKAMIILKTEIADFKYSETKRLDEEHKRDAIKKHIYRKKKKREAEDRAEISSSFNQDQLSGNKELLKRIKEKLSPFPAQQALFDNYIHFLSTYHQELSRLVTIKEKAFKTFELKYKYYPPGDVKKIVDYKTNQVRYDLERDKRVLVSTAKYGWRVEFYFHSIFSNCNNLGLKIISLAIYGRLGIRRLYGTTVFYPNDCVYVDETSGKFHFIPGTEVTTIYTLIRSMFRHIKNSREKYKEKGQGSCLGNISHWFFHYVIRVLFEGVLFYSVLMPVMIIVHFVVCLLFINLSIFLGIAASLLFGFVNIFLYDFVAKPLEEIIDFSIILPLPLELVNTIINGLFQIIFSVLLISLSPIAFTLLFLYCCIKYFLRFFITLLSFPFFLCCCKPACYVTSNGESPCCGGLFLKEVLNSKNLKILHWDDLLYILLAHLERIEVESRIKVLKHIIDEEDSKIRDIVNSYGLTKNERKMYQEQADLIFRETRQMKTNLSIKQQERVPPFLLNDLSSYRLNHCSPEDLYLQIKKLAKCIEVFILKKNLEFIWKLYPDLPKGDYELLTKKIIQNVLGIQAFETPNQEGKVDFQEFHKEPDFYQNLDTLLNHKMGNEWLIDHFDKYRNSKKQEIWRNQVFHEFVDVSAVLQTTIEIVDKPLEHSLLLDLV